MLLICSQGRSKIFSTNGVSWVESFGGLGPRVTKGAPKKEEKRKERERKEREKEGKKGKKREKINQHDE